MRKQYSHLSIFFYLIPLVGILVFTVLYFYAASIYPGGSQSDMHAVGFSWQHNYWCNLMNEKAINGSSNPARPYAITAMAVLCLSLLFFFILFARTFSSTLFWKRTIGISGALSMLFALFIFTAYHDLMTILSSFFGLFTVVGIIWEIYKSKLTAFKYSGALCILLLAVNNYIYYTQVGIEYLPLLQKVSFVVVLLWIGGLNLYLLKNR